MSKALPPVIIAGMHRSGTTLLASLLKDMGLFIGWSLQVNHEPLFFRDRARAILAASGGSWDRPEPLDALLSRPEMCAAVSAQLRKDCSSLEALSFLGPRRYLRHRSLFTMDTPWGWKEPQTTATLPLWLGAFPDARVVHVYRNGLDVARSLQVREERRVVALTTPGMSQGGRSVDRGLLLTLGRKVRKLRLRAGNGESYRRLGVRSVLDLEEGLRVWRAYLDRVDLAMRSGDIPLLAIRYEDLLQHPLPILVSVADFCGLAPTPECLAAMAGRIRPERAYAFWHDPELAARYRTLREDPWMRRLGYGALVPEDAA